MNLFKQLESVNSADGGKSSASDSTLIRVTDMLQKKTSIERPAVPVSGESRYLTQLWVFRNREPWEELHQSDASLPRIVTQQNHEIQEKIRAALKLLTFREQHVLVQFWWPHAIGKHRLLRTVDQPFGLGTVDEGLISYRRDSECNPFLVDKDDEEEDSGPPARVYRRGLPEWTSDLTRYAPKDFPLQQLAIRLNLCGYLALPVVDSTTSLCVGVLEVLMSSKYTSYAYEVQQIHKAFKTTNLATPQVFDWPTSNAPGEKRQNRMDKIHSILRAVCDIHGLPLAQTWSLSPFCSYVVHEKKLQKSCNSFDTKCIGKVCMSTSGLPFHVRDLGMWQFREACRERHLETYHDSHVGRAFSSHGSCFCGDVSQLSEQEYPLVYNARISRLTSCFTIFLHTLEDQDDDHDYVLQFFLPNGRKCVPDLVETLKQTIGVDSGFELGDVSSMHVVEPFKGDQNLSLDIEPHNIQGSWTTEAMITLLQQTGSPHSESIVPNVAKTAVVGKGKETLIDAVKKKPLKRGRKRKIDSLTLEAIQQHLGKPIGQAAESLGVGLSTLKRFCREHNIPSWSVVRHNNKTAIVKEPRCTNNIMSSEGCFSINDDLGLMSSDHLQEPTKRTVANALDMDTLMVKASFKENMIRFPFPISSGMLELLNEVAQRIDLQGRSPLLKYKDEEGDLVLINCDADLQSVIGCLGSNNTLKLIIELADQYDFSILI